MMKRFILVVAILCAVRSANSQGSGADPYGGPPMYADDPWYPPSNDPWANQEPNWDSNPAEGGGFDDLYDPWNDDSASGNNIAAQPKKKTKEPKSDPDDFWADMLPPMDYKDPPQTAAPDKTPKQNNNNNNDDQWSDPDWGSPLNLDEPIQNNEFDDSFAPWKDDFDSESNAPKTGDDKVTETPKKKEEPKMNFDDMWADFPPMPFEDPPQTATPAKTPQQNNNNNNDQWSDPLNFDEPIQNNEFDDSFAPWKDDFDSESNAPKTGDDKVTETPKKKEEPKMNFDDMWADFPPMPDLPPMPFEDFPKDLLETIMPQINEPITDKDDNEANELTDPVMVAEEFRQLAVFPATEDSPTDLQETIPTTKTPAPAASCADNPCQNNGECVDVCQGFYMCFCPDGFEGNNCEIDTRTTPAVEEENDENDEVKEMKNTETAETAQVPLVFEKVLENPAENKTNSGWEMNNFSPEKVISELMELQNGDIKPDIEDEIELANLSLSAIAAGMGATFLLCGTAILAFRLLRSKTPHKKE